MRLLLCICVYVYFLNIGEAGGAVECMFVKRHICIQTYMCMTL